MKLAPGLVICACGWHGVRGAKSPCPACNRPAIDRVDAARIAVLRRVLLEPELPIEPRSLALRLVQIGVLRRDGPPPPPTDVRKRRAPRRRHAVTELGLRALAAADQIDMHRKHTKGTP